MVGNRFIANTQAPGNPRNTLPPGIHQQNFHLPLCDIAQTVIHRSFLIHSQPGRNRVLDVGLARRYPFDRFRQFFGGATLGYKSQPTNIQGLAHHW